MNYACIFEPHLEKILTPLRRLKVENAVLCLLIDISQFLLFVFNVFKTAFHPSVSNICAVFFSNLLPGLECISRKQQGMLFVTFLCFCAGTVHHLCCGFYFVLFSFINTSVFTKVWGLIGVGSLGLTGPLILLVFDTIMEGWSFMLVSSSFKPSCHLNINRRRFGLLCICATYISNFAQPKDAVS